MKGKQQTVTGHKTHGMSAGHPYLLDTCTVTVSLRSSFIYSPTRRDATTYWSSTVRYTKTILTPDSPLYSSSAGPNRLLGTGNLESSDQ